MRKELTVTNIQRMCFHDGPGIRTTVFTKGCSLHCPWCSNPENISGFLEPYEKDGKAGIYGKKYTSPQLIEILLKDRDFWEPEGGVTGGEPLLQADALQELLVELKELWIHTVAETALFVPETYVRMVLPYIDYFIVDVKILKDSFCREVLGGDLELYKRNVQHVYCSGKLGVFRIPCCPEYTFTEQNRELLLKFLMQYPEIPVQIFTVHSFGEKKYESLKRPVWRTKGVDRQQLLEYCAQLGEYGIKAEVIQI